MVRKIIPPYTPGDQMAMTRLWQSVRDLTRKNTVEVNKIRDDLAHGTATQNLLSSSLLHVSPDAQFTLSTTNAVHRHYLGQTIGDDAFGSLVEMGLSPGDVISASIEALPTGGQVARIQLIFSVSKVFSEDNSVSTTISTHLGLRVTSDTVLPPAQPTGSPAKTAVIASDFGITKVESIRIPDGAVFVQINAISDSTSTAGDITWRQAMLNVGSTVLSYSVAPLRSDRENTLIGQQSYLELDSTDAYVTVPDNSAWDFAANVTRTIEIEFLANDFFPLSGDSPLSTESLIRKKLFVGNGWRAFYREGGTIGVDVLLNSAEFPDGEFATPLKRIHLAMTRDATGVHRLYVNGKFGVTFTDNTDISNTAALLFGAFPDGVGGFKRFLDGRLYYVRIWDVVRTQQELIDDRYTVFPDSTTNLRGDWQFNEQSGKIVRNHGDVASTDGVIVGTGFIWRGPAVNILPNFTNLPIETSIAAGDFIPMEDITDNLSGKITFANFESTLNHDSLAGFVANEHIDHTTVSVTAGTGLSGGGTIAATRTINLDLNSLGNETTIASGDFISMVDITDSASQKITFANFESSLTPTAHAASHTDGTDDIQNATSGQKGLATSTQITKLDGIETSATADQTTEEIQDIAGPLVASGGTKTGITVTYQDGTDDMDFEVAIADLSTSGTVELATVTETNTGTDATRAVTPDGLDGWTGSAQVVTVGTLSAGDVTSQVSAASLSAAGKIEIADVTETNTGTDATRAVSPDGLDGWTGSAQVVTVGTLSAGDVTAQVTAASLSVAGKIEIATGAETNTGTDATRAVSPDGLDDWTGSAQIDTVGTLSSGDVTTQVSASSDSLAGRVELATDAETVTGTDTARATTPANITAKMSAPGPIGDTTPSTGAFTTGDFTGDVTPNANVFVGDTATRPIGGDNPAFQVTGTGDDTSSESLQRFSANVSGPVLHLGKSRSGSIGTYTVVQDNDALGTIRASAADGSDMLTRAAQIILEVDDAAPAANSIGGAIVFETAPGTGTDDITEVGRFRADGHLELSNGIQIGGTGAANLLEDYEEGTFTPTIQDDTRSDAENQTYTTQTGFYTKTGNRVEFNLRLSISDLGDLTTGQSAVIGGLPFTSVSTSNSHGSEYWGAANNLSITAGNTPTARIAPSETVIRLSVWDATAGDSNFLISNLSDTSLLQLAGFYMA